MQLTLLQALRRRVTYSLRRCSIRPKMNIAMAAALISSRKKESRSTRPFTFTAVRLDWSLSRAVSVESMWIGSSVPGPDWSAVDRPGQRRSGRRR